jgi:hypothetical protein
VRVLWDIVVVKVERAIAMREGQVRHDVVIVVELDGCVARPPATVVVELDL